MSFHAPPPPPLIVPIAHAQRPRASRARQTAYYVLYPRKPAYKHVPQLDGTAATCGQAAHLPQSGQLASRRMQASCPPASVGPAGQPPHAGKLPTCLSRASWPAAACRQAAHLHAAPLRQTAWEASSLRETALLRPARPLSGAQITCSAQIARLQLCTVNGTG